MCAGTVDEVVAISQRLPNIQWQAGRQAQGGTLGEEQRVRRDCGQNPCDQPAFFSCHREILVWGYMELCPDNLIRTNTPAALDNGC